MNKILYINGCSHSCGSEISHPLSNRTLDDLRLSWAGKLADKLNMTHHNDALPGQDNICIYSNTIHSLLDLLDKHDSSDIKVIIGWTAWERKYFIHDNRVYNFSPGLDTTEWFKKYPKEVKDAFRDYILNMNYDNSINKFALLYHGMINFLHSKNIEYLFFNSVNELREPKSNLLHRRVNDNKPTTKLFDMIRNDPNYYHPFSTDHSYYHYMKKKYDPHVDGRNHHFTADAQTDWTSVLWNTSTIQRWANAT